MSGFFNQNDIIHYTLTWHEARLTRINTLVKVGFNTTNNKLRDQFTRSVTKANRTVITNLFNTCIFRNKTDEGSINLTNLNRVIQNTVNKIT